MDDRQFLQWIHDRIMDRYGESPNLDYMHRLRAIIDSTPPDRKSSPGAWGAMLPPSALKTEN